MAWCETWIRWNTGDVWKSISLKRVILQLKVSIKWCYVSRKLLKLKICLLYILLWLVVWAFYKYFNALIFHVCKCMYLNASFHDIIMWYQCNKIISSFVIGQYTCCFFFVIYIYMNDKFPVNEMHRKCMVNYMTTKM